MVDKPQPGEPTPAPAAQPGTPGPQLVRRGPGHRGADMRDTVAEMAERAQLISKEAGTKVAAAMRDVISAAAGIAGFTIESARDLVQYMVKRGQMTADEADKLIREAEAAHDKRPASEKARPSATKVAAEKAAIAKAEAAARAAEQAAAMQSFRPAMRPAAPPPPAPPKVATPNPAPVKAKAAAKSEKSATKAATKPPAKAAKPAAKSAKPAKASKAAPAKKPGKGKR